MITWIASYPRSGNTFFRMIFSESFKIEAYTIYKGGKPYIPDTIENLRHDDKMYYIKTHGLPTKEMKDDKVIYLLRDGRESTVSYKNYLKDFSGTNATLNEIISGCFGYGSWSEHVRQWNPSERQNTFLIRFEDLIAEPEKTLYNIADFINMPIKEVNVPSFEELHKRGPKFFRSGKTDSWKEDYSEMEHLYFWMISQKEMEKYSYNNEKPKFIDNSDYSVGTKLLFELIATMNTKQLLQNSNIKDELKDKDGVIANQKKQIEKNQDELKDKDRVIANQKKEIDDIYKSKKWRLVNFLATPIKVFRK